MIFEMLAGYAALRVIQDSVKRQEDADRLSDSLYNSYDWRENAEEQKKADEYNARQKARIEENKEWETEQLGAPVRRNENDEWIYLAKNKQTEKGILSSIILENGKIYHELKLENGEIEQSWELGVDTY